MIFSENRLPPRIKSGAGFFRIMLFWWSMIFSENRLSTFPDHALSVSGLARQHAQIDTDLLQRLFIFRGDIGAEDQIRIRRAMQPAVSLNLAFELARSPTGVAEREDRARR